MVTSIQLICKHVQLFRESIKKDVQLLALIAWKWMHFLYRTSWPSLLYRSNFCFWTKNKFSPFRLSSIERTNEKSIFPDSDIIFIKSYRFYHNSHEVDCVWVNFNLVSLKSHFPRHFHRKIELFSIFIFMHIIWHIFIRKESKNCLTLQLYVCVRVYVVRLLPIKPLNCFICLVENNAVDADYFDIVTP